MVIYLHTLCIYYSVKYIAYYKLPKFIKYNWKAKASNLIISIND